MQTVLSQNLQNASNVNKLIENVCQNGNHLNMNTFGSCSSLITTGHVVPASVNGGLTGQGMVQQQQLGQQRNGAICGEQGMNSSVSSAEEPLSVADVADLLHPQYAIITGE